MNTAVPLSEHLGAQLCPADKATLDYFLAHPGDPVYKACIAGHPKTTKRGSRRKLANIKKKPEVSRYLDAKRRELEAATGIKLQHALMELAAIGFSNIYDYFNVAEDGETLILKSKDQVNIAQQRAVKQLKVKTKTFTAPDGTITKESEVTLQTWDKQRAWSDIARLLGWSGQGESDLPEGVRQLLQIGVLVLPQNQSPEEAIKTYLPYDTKIIEAEK